MIAVLRYLFLKSRRDRSLAGFIIAPAALLAPPLLITAVVHLIRGQRVYPASLDMRGGPAATAAMFGGEVLPLVASLVAGIASFWVLRDEISNRAVGFFLLARQARVIAAASIVYGLVEAMAAMLVSELMIVTLTANVPPHLPEVIGVAVVASLAAATLGVALVSFSPETTMLIPLYVMALFVTETLAKSPDRRHFAAALAISLIAAAAAPILLRRRCAA